MKWGSYLKKWRRMVAHLTMSHITQSSKASCNIMRHHGQWNISKWWLKRVSQQMQPRQPFWSACCLLIRQIKHYKIFFWNLCERFLVLQHAGKPTQSFLYFSFNCNYITVNVMHGRQQSKWGWIWGWRRIRAPSMMAVQGLLGYVMAALVDHSYCLLGCILWDTCPWLAIHCSKLK